MQPSGMRLNNTPQTYFLAEQVFALALLFIDKNIIKQSPKCPDLLLSTKRGTRYAPLTIFNQTWN